MQPNSLDRIATPGWMISVSLLREGVWGGCMVVALGLCVGGCNAQGGVNPGEGITPTGGASGSGGNDIPDARGETAPILQVPEAGSGIDTQPGCKDYTVCCGNGVHDPGEECDDSNKESGDGCSAACKTEVDWSCPLVGPCTSTVVCSDGRISGDEVCDDRNTVSGDGCSADCKTVEPGWVCNAAGVRCQPKCGDGVLKGSEQCDDNNTIAGDGCSPTCKVESGYACPTPGQPCHKTVCGDGIKEGDESCDDGNLLPNDGCTPDCKAEPQCVVTKGCTSPCGDGLKLPTEECDDGNTQSGDGCSSDCHLEPGWSCKAAVETPGSTLSVPILYRDMLQSTDPITDPPPHPNFEVPVAGGLATGIVQPTLGTDGKPVYNDAVNKTNSNTTNATDFNSWYHDSAYSTVVPDSLVLTAQANGTYVYDHSASCRNYVCTTPPFFPLDNRGWAAPGGPEVPYLGLCSDDNQRHNFSFTSELRYWFEYMGGERLDFIGDDDVWVFVNGYLAVDIGGVHRATAGSVTLNAAAATAYGLTQHQIYEIVVFQAERRLTQSSYKLTIGQFNRTRTVCAPTCGDGIVNGTEICDNGPNNSDTAYGGCTTQCTLGPYCGDGKVDTAYDEECDDGVNLSPTYGSGAGCAPGCRKPHYCGDGFVDNKNGEDCDDGPKNGTPGSWCQIDCRLIVP